MLSAVGGRSVQVGQLGADYDKWVHDPIVQKEPPRFFESDLAEVRTRTVSSTSSSIGSPETRQNIMGHSNENYVMMVFPACSQKLVAAWSVLHDIIYTVGSQFDDQSKVRDYSACQHLLLRKSFRK